MLTPLPLTSSGPTSPSSPGLRGRGGPSPSSRGSSSSRRRAPSPGARRPEGPCGPGAGRRSRAARSCASGLPSHSINARASRGCFAPAHEADGVVDDRRAARREDVARGPCSARISSRTSGRSQTVTSPSRRATFSTRIEAFMTYSLVCASRRAEPLEAALGESPSRRSSAARIMPKIARIVPEASGSRIRTFPFQRGSSEVVPVARRVGRRRPRRSCRR